MDAFFIYDYTENTYQAIDPNTGNRQTYFDANKLILTQQKYLEHFSNCLYTF